MEYLWERVRSFLPRDDLLCLRESQVPRRMRLVRARLDDCVVAVGTCTPSAVLGRRNDVTRVTKPWMETTTTVQTQRCTVTVFRVEWTIEVFPKRDIDEGAQSGH